MAELSNIQKLQVDAEIKKAKEELENNLVSYEKIGVLTGFQKEMISILHKSVAKGTTVSELAYFLSYAKGVGLNPLNKEIWCYKDNKDNVLIFTGRDGFLKKNKENPLYRGMRSSEVMEFDEFSLDMIEGKVEHKISNNRGKVILGGYAIVSIEGQKDTIVWLDFEEFNLNQAKWKTSPKYMIKKCAQSHALKEACGMTGIQAEESFIIKNDTAFGKGDMAITNGEKSFEKEDERLLKLIAAASSLDSLKKLFNDCNTPEMIEAYDAKKKTFEV